MLENHSLNESFAQILKTALQTYFSGHFSKNFAPNFENADEILANFSDDGFFCDFLLTREISEADLPKIQDLMRENQKIPGVFSLTGISGAYFQNDEKNSMLSRISGVAFADENALQTHLTQIDEAKKRDHRKLGAALKIFAFDDEIGAGMALWLPNGGRIRRRLEILLENALISHGYEPVRGPQILKTDLWKKSGHYENYRENMYFTRIDETEYGLKPMNCIGHIKIFQTAPRSYRELPLRFYEYGLVHRHEKSGALHGLLRVREFTQDDAHIFCRAEDIGREVAQILKFTDKIMGIFGFSYEMQLSTRPHKSIGDTEIWDLATDALKNALKNVQNYTIDEGGGAFYGPKIDIKITDAIGRKWQCGTIQIDMNLPERFDLACIDESGARSRIVMIHRAILGSFERFIAICIEHFAGALPLFIAPIQVVFVPISADDHAYVQDLAAEFSRAGIYTQILDKNESLGKKIRACEQAKVPYVAVVGKKERQENSLSIRARADLGSGQFSVKKDEFLAFLCAEMKKIEEKMLEN